MNSTINETMSLMRAVRERVNELKALRQQTAVKERYYGGMSSEIQRAVEPQYDMKKLDKKIMQLNNFLYKADAAIKQSNANTKVALDGVDPDALLAEIE